MVEASTIGPDRHPTPTMQTSSPRLPSAVSDNNRLFATLAAQMWMNCTPFGASSGRSSSFADENNLRLVESRGSVKRSAPEDEDPKCPTCKLHKGAEAVVVDLPEGPETKSPSEDEKIDVVANDQLPSTCAFAKGDPPRTLVKAPSPSWVREPNAGRDKNSST